jgi:hypothetical protein
MSQREWLPEIRGSNIVILGVINGLVSEIEIVKEALEKHKPQALGVALSGSEVEGVRIWNRDSSAKPEYTEFDAFYTREMSKYGEIKLPSPSFSYTVAVSDATGIPLYPLDIDDDEYSELYLRNVSPVSLFFSSLLNGRSRKKSVGGTVEEAVCTIDRLAMRPKGLAAVEREREKHIAENIRSHSKDYSPFFAVVAYERVGGVLHFLNE